jgi:hypothetical protein
LPEDNAVLSILGSLDIKNIFNSDLNINGNNFPSKILLQLIKNFDLTKLNPALPEGTLNQFDISLKGSDILINNFEYISKPSHKNKFKREGKKFRYIK